MNTSQSNPIITSKGDMTMLEKLKNENLAKAFGVSEDTLNQISVYLSLLAIIISIVSMVIA